MNNSYGNHKSSLSTFLSDKDILTRHKWPEEKPKWTDDYLVNLPGRKNGERVVMYYSVEWDLWGFRDGTTLITPPHEPDHWWNLPEMRDNYCGICGGKIENGHRKAKQGQG